MLLAKARLFECLGAHDPTLVIENAFRPILLDPIALDVSQVQLGGLGAARRKPHDVSFDNDATGAAWTGTGTPSRAAAVVADSTAHQRQDGDAQRRRLAVGSAVATISEAWRKNRQFVGITQS